MATGTTTKKTEGTTFPTRNDISAEIRAKSVSLLNQHLADTFDLMSQTKFAHWNVKGPNFIALHKLFDELAEKLEEHVDEIAERATALGGVALGTARQAATRALATSTSPKHPLLITFGGASSARRTASASSQARTNPARSSICW